LLSDYPLSAKPGEFQEALILESTVAIFNISHNAHKLAEIHPFSGKVSHLTIHN